MSRDPPNISGFAPLNAVRAVQGPPESGPHLWNDRIATEEIERRRHPESSQDCEQETTRNG